LSQIKPHTPLLVVSSRQSLQVSPLRAYYPRHPHTQFLPARAHTQTRRQSLLSELQRYLIDFDPPTSVPRRRLTPRALPPPRLVQPGSSHFTSRPTIRRPLSSAHSQVTPCPQTAPFTTCLTTHSLTATYNTDTPGAGITAAAGTRLALQLKHINTNAPPLTSHHCLSTELGKFRACCHPWTW
jgi:hypothetical protein